LGFNLNIYYTESVGDVVYRLWPYIFQSLNYSHRKQTTNGTIIITIKKKKGKNGFFLKTQRHWPLHASSFRVPRGGAVLFNCWPVVFTDLFNRMISHGPFTKYTDVPHATEPSASCSFVFENLETLSNAWGFITYRHV